jgi:hypothetical protein
VLRNVSEGNLPAGKLEEKDSSITYFNATSPLMSVSQGGETILAYPLGHWSSKPAKLKSTVFIMAVILMNSSCRILST